MPYFDFRAAVLPLAPLLRRMLLFIVAAFRHACRVMLRRERMRQRMLC